MNNIYLNKRKLFVNEIRTINGKGTGNIRIDFNGEVMFKKASIKEGQLKDIDSRIQKVNESMIDRLLKLYNKGEFPTFSQFIRRYDEYIYTKEILKGVYEGVGLKSGFNSWYHKFKKNNNIELLAKSDIIEG